MSDEKTEAPTSKKLDDAKRDGQSPKSADLPAAALFLLGAAALSFAAGPLGEHFSLLLRIGLDVGRAASPQFDLVQAMTAVAGEAAWILVPILAVALLIPVAALVMQVGVNISFKPVELKIDAINPAAGLKRMVSLRSLLDLLKMMLKATALLAVLYKITLLLLPATASLAYQPILDVAAIAWMILCRFIATAGLVYLLLGGADFGIQYWLFIREHRMSKDEIKREYKESEGDPQIKGKRKQIAREDANAPPPSKIADANAVIVNPTHYAVAIRYAPEEHGLPRIIAKGVDENALTIRRYAEVLGVPIIPNPPLARALYVVPVEEAVPEPLFEAVAEVLAWVNQLKQLNQLDSAGGTGERPAAP